MQETDIKHCTRVEGGDMNGNIMMIVLIHNTQHKDVLIAILPAPDPLATLVVL